MEYRQIEWGSPAYEAALALRGRVLREPLGLSLTADDVEGEQGEWHFVARDGEAVRACVIGGRKGDRVFKIRQMAVEPDWQGQGVGRQLLIFAEEFLRELGAFTLFLHARKPVIGFYEKLGYEAAGPAFEEVGLVHQRMEKSGVESSGV